MLHDVLLQIMCSRLQYWQFKKIFVQESEIFDFLRTDITAEGISLLKKILSNPHSVSQPFL